MPALRLLPVLTFTYKVAWDWVAAIAGEASATDMARNAPDEHTARNDWDIRMVTPLFYQSIYTAHGSNLTV
ncbi:MAG: hypothetical protein M1415_05425 [Firmicutes bacterium]|nr:hypothetical protein [Bacillota bacterium]